MEEFYHTNPKELERHLPFLIERYKSDANKLSEIGWTNGQYVAIAIGTSFSKGKRYPNEPYEVFDMTREHTAEQQEFTDADRFWAFAQAFNKKSETAETVEITGKPEAADAVEITGDKIDASNIENTETLSGDDISW